MNQGSKASRYEDRGKVVKAGGTLGPSFSIHNGYYVNYTRDQKTARSPLNQDRA